MKNFIAVLLAALMSLALFAVSASAAEMETETKVVGGDNGVTDFTDTPSNGHDINVKVDQVTHKYAVDLTFDFSDLTIGGIEWDVNDMRYKVNGTLPSDTSRDITVTNRSDLPVYAIATCTDADAGDFVTVSVPDTKVTVGKATAGTGSDNGTASTNTITVSISSTAWVDAVNYYANKMIADTNPTEKTYKLAIITVTISKSAS